MQFVDGKEFVYFDCDDTLVLWVYPDYNTYHIDDFLQIWDEEGGYFNHLYPSVKTVQALKDAKKAGSTIVVWSAGGAKWAKSVVTALNLQEYVDLVTAKPHKYYDDIPCTEFMGTRYDLNKGK